MRAPYVALAVTAALAAVVVVGDLGAPAATRPARQQTQAEKAALTTLTLACPDVAGKPDVATTRVTAASASGTGSVTFGGLSPRPMRTALRSARSLYTQDVRADGGSMALRAQGSIAGGLEAEQTSFIESGPARSLADARCVRPGHEFWFLGLAGLVDIHDQLWLMNADDDPASVDLSIWGDKGPVSSPRLEGISIKPHSRVVLPIDEVAPDVPRLGLRVVATSGRVAAAVRDQRQHGTVPDGTDWIPATLPPATSAVVPGFPTGQGNRAVFVTNPGSDDANVTLKVLTDSGAFVPTGFDGRRVAAGTTAFFDLRPVIGNTVATVVVTSDQPVAVGGSTSRGKGGYLTDRAWTAATPPITTRALVTDVRVQNASSVLLLSAPQAGGRVVVETLDGTKAVLSVPAGRTVWYAPDLLLPSGSGALVVTPVKGSGPVYVARVLAMEGAHGPLLTVLPLVDVPGSVTLPPAAYDERAALPQPG